MFYTFQGAKDIFFPKVTQIWSSTGKKIKNSLSSFFKIGGGGGGVEPEMTNVIFFLFFFNEGFPKLKAFRTRESSFNSLLLLDPSNLIILAAVALLR